MAQQGLGVALGGQVAAKDLDLVEQDLAYPAVQMPSASAQHITASEADDDGGSAREPQREAWVARDQPMRALPARSAIAVAAVSHSAHGLDERARKGASTSSAGAWIATRRYSSRCRNAGSTPSAIRRRAGSCLAWRMSSVSRENSVGDRSMRRPARVTRRGKVDLEIVLPQRRQARRPPATQHRADARQSLGEGEGFDQVVIGAHFEAGDAVDHAVARGEYEHGEGNACSTQLAQDPGTIEPGRPTSSTIRSKPPAFARSSASTPSPIASTRKPASARPPSADALLWRPLSSTTSMREACSPCVRSRRPRSASGCGPWAAAHERKTTKRRQHYMPRQLPTDQGTRRPGDPGLAYRLAYHGAGVLHAAVIKAVPMRRKP